MHGTLTFREQMMTQFLNRFGDCGAFRIVQAKRGQPCPHKIVLIFCKSENADLFCAFLTQHHVFTYRGYSMTAGQMRAFSGCQAVAGRIVELPVEANEARMTYMMNRVSDFLEVLNGYKR